MHSNTYLQGNPNQAQQRCSLHTLKGTQVPLHCCCAISRGNVLYMQGQSWLINMCVCVCVSLLSVNKKRRTRSFFQRHAQEQHMSLSLASHCPEPSHLVTPSCKGVLMLNETLRVPFPKAQSGEWLSISYGHNTLLSCLSNRVGKVEELMNLERQPGS